MDVEEAQNKVAVLKTWHLLMFVYISTTVSIGTSWQEFAIVFVGYQPEHYCAVPDNSSLPPHRQGREGLFHSCDVYVDIGSGSNKTRPCTEGWTYVDADGPVVVPYQGSTIVTEWDLVCDNAHLKDFPQSMLVVGVMLGAMGFSALSDHIGRKPVFLFSQWTMVVVSVANSFVTNYSVFVFFRFCVGMLQQGIMLPGYIMACELFAAKYRTFSGILCQNFWGVAAGVLPFIAYLITDWHHFQLFISLTGILTIPMFWLMPESVIWLVANDRNEEAEKILQNAARINKIEMPQRILPRSEKDDDGTTGLLSALRRLDPRRRSKSKKTEFDGDKVYGVLDLVKNRRLLLHSVVMSALWMINSMVYYGVSLSTATLAGDRFVNASLIAFIEVPAYTIAYFVLQKWGRRYPLIAYHIVAGLALLVTQFIPHETDNGTSLVWLIILFNLIGKFGITGAFGIVFLYAPEIFPTTLRNQSMGVASLLGRLGNVLATYTPFVTAHVPWLPGPLFGGLSIAAGTLVMLLPETHNRPLPQTIEDIDNWYKPQNQQLNNGKNRVQGEDQEDLGPLDNDVNEKLHRFA